MLAAYLRGMLKPSHKYGLRSLLAENVIFEGVSAELSVAAYETAILSDASMLPVFNEKGIRDTMHSISKRAARCMELRLMDVYRMARRLDGDAGKSGKKELSLYQLYQIAVKNGIFDALRQQQES
jgi:hypothetical protein